jgi:hypothetical protein
VIHDDPRPGMTSRCQELPAEHASPSTRRTLLGVAGAFILAASGLFVPRGQEADASRPVNRVQQRAAKRRQRRHHRREHQRDQQQHDPGAGVGGPQIFQKGISMLLNNHLDHYTEAELGILISGSHSHCSSPAIFNMPPGDGIALYDTRHPEAYSWVEARYFFGFFNPETGLPEVWMGLGGSSKGNCHHGGTRLLNDTGLTPGQVVTVTVEDRRFVIARQGDKENFKFFSVDIFAT